MAKSRVVVDLHDDRGHLAASWIGTVHDAAWTSGFSAPFGGIDLVKDHVCVELVNRLVERGLRVARDLNLDRVEVRCKPPHFSHSEPHVLFALLQAGFTVTASDLNYFIDLSSCRDLQDWKSGLRRESRRDVRQAMERGCTVARLAQDDESGWHEAYDVIARNRIAKGWPMHLPFDYVTRLRDQFPGLIRVTVIRRGKKVVAAALVYRIASGRDLVQYWGHHGHNSDRSPMPLLAQAIVEQALETGARTIDVGISTNCGEPNLGLMHFKRSVGCRVEPRLVLSTNVLGPSHE